MSDTSSSSERPPTGPPDASMAWKLSLVLPAALAAGLLAWGCLLLCFPVFKVPASLGVYAGPAPTFEESAREAAYGKKVRGYNAAVFGAIVGTALALAVSLTAQTPRPASVRMPLGLLVGAGLGCAAGFAAHLVRESPALAKMEPLHQSIVTQGVLLGLLGATAGLVATIQHRQGLGGIFAGAIGGVLVGVVYPLLVATALPAVKTTRVVAQEPLAQLLWVVMAFGIVAVTTVGLTSRKRRRTAPPTDADDANRGGAS